MIANLNRNLLVCMYYVIHSMYYVVSGFAIVTDYKFMHGILGIPSDELWIELTLLGCNKIYPFAHWNVKFISTLGYRGPPFTRQEGVGKFWRSNYMQFSEGSYRLSLMRLTHYFLINQKGGTDCNKIYPFAHWHAIFISTLLLSLISIRKSKLQPSNK